MDVVSEAKQGATAPDGRRAERRERRRRRRGRPRRLGEPPWQWDFNRVLKIQKGFEQGFEKGP